VRLTVVIPTYNEAENLEKVVSALFALPLDDLHILIVDDNSPDGTGQIADRLAAENSGRLAVLHRAGKSGLGTAYVAGFRYALADGADAICQMDADFSHPPEKLVELVQAIECCDVAQGSRYVPGGSVDKRWPLWRKALSAFGSMYARAILGLKVRDTTAGFRLWRRAALAGLPLDRLRSNGYSFQVELVYLAHLLGYSLVEIPIYFADRHWGKSKMSFRIQREAAVRVWQMLFEYRYLKRQHPQTGRPDQPA
jgi:dolichol-phosphate mannosyltransferase